MHLQNGVLPHDHFVRCIGIGPDVRIVEYDPQPRFTSATRPITTTWPRRRWRPSGRSPSRSTPSSGGTSTPANASTRRACGTRSTSPTRARTAGDLAPPPLPMAGSGQPALGALQRGDEAEEAAQPGLVAVLRDRGRPGQLRGEARSVRGHQRGADGHCGVRRVLRGAPRSTREVAWEYFGSKDAREAVREKVAALFPEHEVEEFTERFWQSIQDWRVETAQSPPRKALTDWREVR